MKEGSKTGDMRGTERKLKHVLQCNRWTTRQFGQQRTREDKRSEGDNRGQGALAVQEP